MYETMVYWETRGAGAHDNPVSREFAEIWRAAEKVRRFRSGFVHLRYAVKEPGR